MGVAPASLHRQFPACQSPPESLTYKSSVAWVREKYHELNPADLLNPASSTDTAPSNAAFGAFENRGNGHLNRSGSSYSGDADTSGGKATRDTLTTLTRRRGIRSRAECVSTVVATGGTRDVADETRRRWNGAQAVLTDGHDLVGMLSAEK